MDSLFTSILSISRVLQHSLLTPLCTKYGLTQTELLTLFFLAESPAPNTASDIVREQKLTKSAVSMAVRELRERGLISGECTDQDHRSVRLSVCEAAQDILHEGARIQRDLYHRLTNGFSEAEKAELLRIFARVSLNLEGE